MVRLHRRTRSPNRERDRLTGTWQVANRVSEQELREYLVGVPAELPLTQYIDDAHTLMDLKMGASPSVGEPLARMIEKNLAAHMYTLAQDRGGVIEKKVGDSTEKYATGSNKTTGIGSTSFGQIVLSLTDAFNGMQSTDKKKAQFRVV